MCGQRSPAQFSIGWASEPLGCWGGQKAEEEGRSEGKDVTDLVLACCLCVAGDVSVGSQHRNLFSGVLYSLRFPLNHED